MKIIAQPAFKDRDKNPYTWLVYTHLATLGVDVHEFSPKKLLINHYSIWHRHWPERNLNEPNFFRAIAKTLALLFLMILARWRGTKIVWTVHNLASHEQLYPQLEAWFWKVFTRQLDGYINLSKTGMKAAQERFPQLKNIPGFVVPHGHYRGQYPNQVSSQEARNYLGITNSAKVLLLFGRIRPYKNAPQLIRVFRKLFDSEAILYIVGSPEFTELAAEIERESALDQRVRINLDFIPQDHMQWYFSAADLVILPYREILNSGSAFLALSFNRPILVPKIGALPEVQEQVGEEWVYTYTGEITDYDIEKALDWALNTPRPEQAPLEAFDWQELANQTINAYNEIASYSRKRRKKLQ
ncbi:MAG: glycosyltransferase family 4 protein [Moorea sp. SIO1F2]|uniref:glycosyltransferase family 4 protein n=2 Tax=Moorena TaxID=1155738 RepID=UPI0013BB2CA6|nr:MULTISPECIES: glycosyltransferase family 4 protein [unclassified Moorena]NEN97476.1 glycosyltransferase family 4 protein [Moorena sp. SIO3I7]NEO08328.1 glycosyltransferase family 4 protein [Moorena sp. SIO3I8]NEP25522.1 glycosyltransferase family 4 protein [Moorena sp. SIO3I6]NEQ59784.1 glycosyltransferase family 4 protein [Moorena sp. SIO4A1]NET83544.1 glycosyltransferase family 4 protein [Moorena sp. SIO1F2]